MSSVCKWSEVALVKREYKRTEKVLPSPEARLTLSFPFFDVQFVTPLNELLPVSPVIIVACYLLTVRGNETSSNDAVEGIDSIFTYGYINRMELLHVQY